LPITATNKSAMLGVRTSAQCGELSHVKLFLVFFVVHHLNEMKGFEFGQAAPAGMLRRPTRSFYEGSDDVR